MKARSSVQVIKARSDQLRFGKYKGDTIERVLKHDPSYLLWCHDEHIAQIDKSILDLAEEMYDVQRLDEAMDGGFGFPWMWEYHEND